MSAYSDLCVQAPIKSHGVPIGNGLDDWRLCVEMAMPGDPSALLGSFVLGESALSSFAWRDVSSEVQGITWRRGGSPGDRPVPGDLTLQLNNNGGNGADGEAFSRWSEDDFFFGGAAGDNTYLAPGTLLRVAAHYAPEPNPLKTEAVTLDELSFGCQSNAWNALPVLLNTNTTTTTSANYDLTGSVLQLQTHSFPAAGDGTRACYFLANRGNGLDFFGFIHEGSHLDVVSYVGGVGTVTTIIGSTHKWWQIRESAGTVYYETSYDGINWTVRFTTSTPAWIADTYVTLQTECSDVDDVVTDPCASNAWRVAGINSSVLATTWIPQWTGIVESWEEQTDGVGSSFTVVVTAKETMSVLAGVDDNAVTPVGSGDTVNERVQRLADAALWPFGVLGTYSCTTAYTLQSTDMSANRITEMYLAADSTDALLVNWRDGRIACYDKASKYLDPELVLFSGQHPRIILGDLTQSYHVPAVADSFTTSNDDELLIGRVNLSQVGGTAQTYENTFISGRYRARSYKRSDLITRDVYSDADLSFVANRILDRSSETYRPASVQIDGKQDERSTRFILVADVGQIVRIDTDHVIFNDYAVAGYSVQVSPLNGDDVNMRMTMEFEPAHVSFWIRP